MGLIVSYGIVALLWLFLQFMRLAGGVLCLAGVVLLFRRSARSAAYVMCGLGVCYLGFGAAALWAAEDLGVFGVF
ncbi:hypothetical protein [Streptomyces sp. CB03238]|uniref:hypothetical protein n=1 Tax=Streptomyces sp. CB03238 TaxID=1907777 RepID=UPI000A120150|nr:hypothetical protein [Streptomyces sp. CB03238]ORT54060.1 hypothetical protein BKD26_36560 [Streptomyces sp. CB03238]